MQAEKIVAMLVIKLLLCSSLEFFFIVPFHSKVILFRVFYIRIKGTNVHIVYWKFMGEDCKLEIAAN